MREGCGSAFDPPGGLAELTLRLGQLRGQALHVLCRGRLIRRRCHRADCLEQHPDLIGEDPLTVDDAGVAAVALRAGQEAARLLDLPLCTPVHRSAPSCRHARAGRARR